jgi:hypothetical protein
MATITHFDLREWMSPSEALEMVANAMGGLAILNGTAANRLFYWIIRGRVKVLALEVERIEDAPPPRQRFGPPTPGVDPLRELFKGGVLAAHQLPYTESITEKHVMTIAELTEAARLCGGDFPDLWMCSTIEHRLVSQQHPLARITYTGIRFFKPDIAERMQIDGLMTSVADAPMTEKLLPQSVTRERSPSFKVGRAPDDDQILAKADEMKARGMSQREIAKNMRFEAGFENAGTVYVRELTKGRWKPTGRRKKDA